MGIFGNMMGGGNGNIFTQAVGAMMRGESPRDFMRQLASTNPALRGINLDDLNGEAQRICTEHGVDAGKLTAEIKQSIGK
jgi:hypothetical protein